MEAMRKLVYAFYDESFSFAGFLAKHPDCREALVDVLFGNVFSKPVGRLFEAMGQMADLPEARSLVSAEESR